MAPLYDFSQGVVSSRDSSTLKPSELSIGTGCEYRVGSPHLYKLPGRSDTGEALGAALQGIYTAEYETADDVIIAVAGGSIYESANTDPPNFGTAVVTGLDSTAEPTFTVFKDRLIMTDGKGLNYVREPNGTWRNMLVRTSHTPSASASAVLGSQTRPSSSTGTANVVWSQSSSFTVNPTWVVTPTPYQYGALADTSSGSNVYTMHGAVRGFTSPSSAYDTGSTLLTTAAVGVANEKAAGGDNTTRAYCREEIYAWASAAITEDQHVNLVMDFTAVTSDVNYVVGANTAGSWAVRYSTNGGSTWTLASSGFGDLAKATISFVAGHTALSDNVGNLRVAVACSIWNVEGIRFLNNSLTNYINTMLYPTPSVHTNIYNSYTQGLNKTLHLYDIFATTGGVTLYEIPADTPLLYAVGERYTDGDGVVYDTSFNATNVATITAPSGAYDVTITLPGASAVINSIAQEYVIWRSVAIEGGGWPNFYIIAVVPIATATYKDIFTDTNSPLEPSITGELYPTIDALIPGAEDVVPYAVNDPPPSSKLTVPFNGALVYFPNDEGPSNQVSYTVSDLVSLAAMEHVPAAYYLSFDTPYTDRPVSGVTCNGGRALMVFFTRYTMLVTYLPQATDPGIFDNRVKEYVTNTRGTAGVQTCCEFTYTGGQTLIASIDSLGLWITDGVSKVVEWSKDVGVDGTGDFQTLMTGVTLSTGRLRDNPVKRRLEFYYADADGNRRALHFFYGRMKQNSDGESSPLYTGPHYGNVNDAHYFNIDNVWRGLGAGSTSAGKVFTENSGDSDDSDGYGSGIVPFDACTGTPYLPSLKDAHLVEFGYPKFTTDIQKEVTLIHTAVRDGGTSRVITKTYQAGTQRKVYIHAYGDRQSIRVQDLTATSMPALVAYEADVRGAGEGRDT